MREIGARVSALGAVLALVSGGGAASAATLKASYQLQGTLASQVAGAPDLSRLGTGGRFAAETVDGTARQVARFSRGGGVSLRTAGIVGASGYSVVMLFRLRDTRSFRRLLDFSGGASDSGLYDLDGDVAIYDAGNLDESRNTAIGAGYVQVTFTSETTLAGLRWNVVYVDGSPVLATTTGSDAFDLSSGVLRFFKDNVHGAGRGEESAGALACALVYDGALTPAETGQVAHDPGLCPAPRPSPPPRRGYGSGTYAGRTSQGLPISITVDATSVLDVAFRWRARCADGRVHTNTIDLGGAAIRRGRFDVRGVLNTGGRARVIGRLAGDRAHGRLSRWANSAFDTTCVARGLRWRAHLIHAGAAQL